MPAVQTLSIENTDNVILEDNTDPSSVLKRQSKDSQALGDSQLDIIIAPPSQIDPVSIKPESVEESAGKQFSAKKIKQLRQRRQKLRRKNKLRAMERFEEV